MSFSRGPKIVTDGLVLALDAANLKSYPGSGTTWSDLSGNGNDGTLVNGPTFDSGNNGSIVFDGMNDYVRSTNDGLSFSTNNTTLSMWVKIKGAGDQSFNRFLDIRPNSGGNLIYFFWDEDDARYGFGNATSFSSAIITGADPILNTWQNWVGVHDYDNNITQFYVNSQLLVSGNQITSLQNSSYSIAIRQDTISDESYIDVASVRVYDKVLTQEEILQNYNATKSRFGL